ncbi:MAG TPA: transcription antiterminator BglG [Bifidobacterium sp.]|nr:transcription antiterminator BglG [Bifidobacterium sp.]
MDVLRVFNNNVVLAKDGDREVILTGRGIGFQAKPGQHVDEAKVVRRFVPADGRDPDHMAQQVAGIPPEIIRLVADAMNRVGLGDQADRQPALVVSLSDHVCGAIRRAQQGQSIEYPLEAEVRSLYADEYAKGKALVDAMNTYLGGSLPDGEAVALALHLVNAGFSTGDMSATHAMTGVIQQMISVIEGAYGITLERTGVNVGRFITHLRYLFVRIHQHEQLDDEPQPIVESIKASYPEAYDCARRLAVIVHMRLGAELTESEIAYLALHVSRVTARHPGRADR